MESRIKTAYFTCTSTILIVFKSRLTKFFRPFVIVIHKILYFAAMNGIASL
jgi:hypothetical protein